MGLKDFITNFKFNNLYEKGLKSLNENDSEKAIEAFESLPEKEQKYAEAMLYCAKIYKALDNYDKAVESYTKIPAHDKLYESSLFSLANLHATYQNYDKSIEVLRRVSVNSGEYMTALLAIISNMIRKGEVDEALKLSKQIPETYEHYGEVLYAIGYGLEELGELDKAIEMYSSIDKIDAAFGKALISKALIYSKKKDDISTALTILSEIHKTSDVYARSVTERISILKNLNKEDEALESYDLLPQNSDNYCYYVFEKYRALNKLERYEEGIEYISKALNESHNEDYLDGLRSISGLYSKLGNKEKSEEYITKANELSQKWFSQGRIASMITTSASSSQGSEDLTKAKRAFRNRNYEKAIMHYKKYAEQETPDANIYNDWGLALLRYGWNIEENEKRKCLLEAIEVGNKAVELDPKEGLYYANLGIYICQLGVLDNNLEDKKAEVIPILMRGEELQKGVSSYTMACVYSLINDMENAFKWFEVMLKYNPLDRSFIESDEDFINMQKDNRFEELLNTYL
ncbi:tetratricopeptide repeat protein [Dysgonomonas sp. GY617]|uniref:tetratricopeptide repeat protein n=1 Tax=Dysgonomonas sp. GY617 TaxID=2780420 RepID=UPI0018839914|nr:tetratricopeptide repeat protein [Dysgonomonas sp. GY617]MBF0577477.1 tetratricopeptide repeat protein [Dysgonomonas sp. GY617]